MSGTSNTGLGGTQPVSGTVAVSSVSGTVAISGTVTTTPPSNASTNVTQWAGTAVDTNSGNKSAGTLRVVIATDQPALTNALKVDGSAVTQPVSGTVAVSNSFALDTSVNGILVAQASTTSGQSGPLIQGAVTTSAPSYTTGKTYPLSLDTSGNLRVNGTFSASANQTVIPGNPTTSLYSQAAVNFSSSGDNTVVAGVTSQTIRVYRIFFVNGDSTNSSNVTIKDSTPTSFSGAFYLAPKGGSFAADGGGDPLWVTASGKGFVLNNSAAVQMSGVVWYTQS